MAWIQIGETDVYYEAAAAYNAAVAEFLDEVLD